MVQVLGRAFGALEMVARDGPLSELSKRLGLNKSTLCVILKTMSSLGYVGQTAEGLYTTGPKLMEVAFPIWRKGTVSRLANEAVRSLAERLREAANAAVVFSGERCTIAHANCQQTIMVDTNIVVHGTFYNSATGRVLLAHMSDAELEDRWKRLAPPPRERIRHRFP